MVPPPVAGGGNRRPLIIVLLFLLLIGGGAGVWWLAVGQGPVAVSPTPSPLPSPSATSADSPGPSQTEAESSFPVTPSPDATPQAGDEFIGYEVTVVSGNYNIFQVDDARSDHPDQGRLSSPRVSQAPVDRLEAPNGLLHWRVTEGGSNGWSYIHDQSGPFLIREVYRGSDGIAPLHGPGARRALDRADRPPALQAPPPPGDTARPHAVAAGPGPPASPPDAREIALTGRRCPVGWRPVAQSGAKWGTVVGRNEWRRTPFLTGEYRHALDDRGRVAVPARFRSRLSAGATLTRWLDSCIAVYPRDAWAELAEKLRGLPLTSTNAREFARFMSSGAVDVELDKQGRLLVPGLPARVRGPGAGRGGGGGGIEPTGDLGTDGVGAVPGTHRERPGGVGGAAAGPGDLGRPVTP